MTASWKPEVAHYRNKLGHAFCGVAGSQDTPADYKGSGTLWSLCITCAKAMYAFATLDDSDRMLLCQKLAEEGVEYHPAGEGITLVARVEGVFPEGFLAVLASVREPALPPSPTTQDGWMKLTLPERAHHIRNLGLSSVDGFMACRLQAHSHGCNCRGTSAKISVIKDIRAATGLGLKESKDISEYLEQEAYATYTRQHPF